MQSCIPEIEHVMKEDMISNALVYLLSWLCDFTAAGDGFVPVPIPAGDRSESLQEDELGLFGKSQKSLYSKNGKGSRVNSKCGSRVSQ